MPPPAGPAPGTASGIVPSVEVHATVHIPSTLAIDARLALRGLYGAGIAAAAAVANSFAARRARELGGNANANANVSANAERKEAVAPAVEATRVTGVGVREEVPEEAVDDEYARMMAELGG
jgi:splicing factor 1